jgi:hypothetical protein
MLVMMIVRNVEWTHSEEYERVAVKGKVGHAVSSDTKDNDGCDELSNSKAYNTP